MLTANKSNVNWIYSSIISIRVIRNDILTISKQRRTEIISLSCALYKRSHSYQNASYILHLIDNIGVYIYQNIQSVKKLFVNFY